MTGQRVGRRLDVKTAADELGITVEALRKRIARGTLRSEKGPDGGRYVWLDEGPDHGRTGNGTGPDVRADALLDAKEETIGELRERVDQLGRILETRDEELRRKDTIIMQMAQRIPGLPPASSQEPRDGHEMVAESWEGVEEQTESEGPQAAPERTEGAWETARRPWWLRWLGG